MTRKIGVVLHSDRTLVQALFDQLIGELSQNGILGIEISSENSHLVNDIEMMVVLGGDGTILKAVEIIHGFNIPILGINLGRVGFLAEAEVTDISSAVDAIVKRNWQTELRTMLEVKVVREDKAVFESFAINDAAIEKVTPELMTELRVSVDDTVLMAFSGDGLIVATSTGSTAYAFSAGGPILWPNTKAIITVPVAAHALFSRPLVFDPSSHLQSEILSTKATLNLDGRRNFDLKLGDLVKVTGASVDLQFARIHSTSFADRLVKKFRLPTTSWRDSDNA
jgi:NAD+ kinase